MFDINLPFDVVNEWFGEDRGDEQRGQNILEQRAWRDHAEAREDSYLQRRTDQARAAGLHPLFSLSGGSGGSSAFSPNPVTVAGGGSVGARFEPGMPSGSRQAAEDRQRLEELAEREQQSRHARTVSSIRTDTEQQSLLRAQTDLVREQIADSIAARTGQLGRNNQERAALTHSPINPEDAFETKLRTVVEGKGPTGGPIAPGPAAAGFEPVWIAPGLPALVPAGSAQNLGDMEFTGWVAAIAATMVWWGDSAAREAYKQIQPLVKGYVGFWEAVERKSEEILLERRGRGR